MEEEYLQLSGIQHFAFCRRQWALIHIENQWAENGQTAEGRQMHERVHDPENSDYRKGILTIRGMMVKSDRLRISGSCDAVEFYEDESGVILRGRPGKWLARPVEYKHGSGTRNDADRLQLALQALCLEEMLSCPVPRGDLFYMKTRRREAVMLTEEWRSRVEDMVREMHEYEKRRYTPKVKPGKACSNCSLADICLPQLMKGTSRLSVGEYVKKHMAEGLE